MNHMEQISDYMAEDLSRASVFESFGIDFCCGGNRSLKEVCQEKGIDVQVVLKSLEEWGDRKEEIDYQSLSRDILCDHIEESHHAYLKEKLPFIQRLLEKMVSSHGNEYAPLLQKFLVFKEDLIKHMEEEEKVVFPKIRSHEDVASDCKVLEKEHNEAGEALEFFKRFTNGYEAPKNACMTHRTALLELEALEKDMHLHVYKENHLLFPKHAD